MSAPAVVPPSKALDPQAIEALLEYHGLAGRSPSEAPDHEPFPLVRRVRRA